MSSSVIIPFAVSFLLPIFLASMKKLFPYDGNKTLNDNIADLELKYKKWESFSSIPILLFTVIGTLLAYSISIYLAEEYHNFLKPYTYIFTTEYKIALLLPSMFLGILASVVPTSALYKRLLKERYQEFDLYTMVKHGVDGKKLIPVAFLLSLSCIVLSFLIVNTYSITLKDRMKVNTFFKLKDTELLFSDVIKIESYYETDNKGTKAKELTYKLYFSNGYVWTNTQGLRNPKKSDRHLIDLILNIKKIDINFIGLKKRYT
jgi:hypothetical protein